MKSSSAIVWKYDRLRAKGKLVGAADMALQSISKRGIDRSKVALNAAAIQDHLMKRFMAPTRKPPAHKPHSNSLARAGKDIMSVLTKPESGIEARDLERKKQSYLHNLTLAERLHIVEQPKPPLTTKEWTEIESRYSKREGDKETCPICQEAFGIKEQVILSCSHVYHKVCLESFERYSSVSICPVCRKQQYDKKSYNEGVKQYAMKCLIKYSARVSSLVIGYRLQQEAILPRGSSSSTSWTSSTSLRRRR